MADNAALGTVMIEFGGDSAKAIAETLKFEKDTVAATKKIEIALGLGVERAYRNAQAAVVKMATAVKTSASVEAHVQADVTKKVNEFRAAIEKARGSYENATEQEIRKTLELEEQLKDVAVAAKLAAEEQAKADVERVKVVPNRYANDPIGPAGPTEEDLALQQNADLAAPLKAYKEQYEKTLKAVTVGNPEMAEGWRKLVGMQVASTAAIKAKYGAVTKATPQEIALLKKQEEQVKALEARVRSMTAEVKRRAGTLGAGMPTNLTDLLKNLTAGYGKTGQAIAMAGVKAGIIIAIVKELWSVVKTVLGALNSKDTSAWWEKQGRAASKWADRTKKGIWDAIFAWGQLKKVQSSDGLLAPMATRAHQFKHDEYEKFRSPFVDTPTRTGHEKDQLQKDYAFQLQRRATLEKDHAAVPAGSGNREVELKEKIDNLTKAEQDYKRAHDQRVAAQIAEYAQLTGNKKALADVNVSLDKLKVAEAVAAGAVKAHAEQVVMQEAANRSLAQTIANISERMEDLGMMREVAAGDYEFDQQKRLTDAYTEQAVALARLTGKSKEHIQALIDQGRQAKIAIELERIARQQATLSLQQEVVQARGNFVMQRSLARAYAVTALNVAVLEKRSKDYIEALRAQLGITLAIIDQDEIGRAQSLVQTQLEIAQLRQQIAFTGQYTRQIDELTAKIEQLNIARLEASPDENDHEMAKLLRQRSTLAAELVPIERLRQFNAIKEDLAWETAQITMQIEAATRESAQRSYEQRVRDYQAMAVAMGLEQWQTDALIVQSAKLRDEQLRQIDADYGKDWGAWLDRLRRKYEDETKKYGVIAERGVSALENMIASMTPSTIKNFEDIKNAAKNMLLAIEQEIMRFIAQKAVQWLLKFPQFGSGATTAASGFIPGSISGAASVGASPIPTSLATVGIPTASSSRFGGGAAGQSAAMNAAAIEPRGGGSGRQVIENHMTVTLGHEFMEGIVGAASVRARQSPGEIIVVVRDNILNGPLRRVIQSVV
jgi:hypothetical protein